MTGYTDDPSLDDDEPLDPRVIQNRAERVAQGLPAKPSPALLAALYEAMRPPRVAELRLRAEQASRRPVDADGADTEGS